MPPRTEKRKADDEYQSHEHIKQIKQLNNIISEEDDMLYNEAESDIESPALSDEMPVDNPSQLPSSLSEEMEIAFTEAHNMSKFPQRNNRMIRAVSTALQHPKELKNHANKSPQLKRIELYDKGNSFDQWSGIAKSVVGLAPKTRKNQSMADLSNTMTQVIEKKSEENALNRMSDQGWKFLRLQGRTVLLENENKKLRAIKIQKLNESDDALSTEFKTTTYLRERAKTLGLQSQYPEALSVNTMSNEYVDQWLKKVLPENDYVTIKKMITTSQDLGVYIYEVDPQECDYFTYLHDPKLSDEQFKDANKRIVHDLYTLLKHGVVFHQLAEIFHNTEHADKRRDRGRYMVLVDLLRQWHRFGSGRITGWKKAVQYPNLRGSGLADVGDSASINDFINEGELAKKFYAEIRKLKGAQSGNFILANLIAEYQFVLFLIAGCRACNLTEEAKRAGKTDAEIDAIWTNIAHQVINNCSQAVSLVINEKEADIANMLHALVDVNRLAQQMRYWMTTDYVPDLMQNKVREGIYEPDTIVSVDITRFREGTFNPEVGCSLNGIDQDLGPVNGQEPIKEANKLFYWMVIKIFAAYNLVHLTVKDLKAVRAEKDVVQSELLRRSLFSHLPQKQYHQLQYTLCEERLKQNDTPKETQEQIEIEKDMHRKEYAALVFQGHWRGHRSKDKNPKEQSPQEEGSLMKLV